jgi:citronellol/citronellal dehydrogenase
MLVESRVFARGALSGQVALVTGGGTNLGKAAATELVRCGATVVIAGRRRPVLEATAEEIGQRCSMIVGDIRDTSGPDAIVSAVLQRHGRLDFLLNNAGGQYFVPAESIAMKGWRAVQRLNVGGTLAMSRVAHARAMRAAGAGMIVNVTVSPHHGMPAMAHTGAARAAVEGLTRELACEWAADGVGVAAVAIGRFDTESLRKYPAELWRSAAQTVPLQRLGRMEEYGWLMALLASPLGRSFSGSVITLDGGLDNWTGPWPPQGLTREGAVPTEERKPATRARERSRAQAAAAGAADDRNAAHGTRVAAPSPQAGPIPVDSISPASGRSVVVAQEPSKLLGRVRFPSPAPDRVT